MAITFEEATLEHSYVRMALTGASGTGKTLTALKLARWLGTKVCVIDTEQNTARLYINHPETPKPYFTYALNNKFQVANYLKLLEEAADQGFDVCIIDSLTPSWNRRNGILDVAGSDIRGWKVATPQYYDLIEGLTKYSTQMHIIATLRSKMDYAMERDEASGKMVVAKKGLAPIHRDELVYEFDIVGDLDAQHTITFGGVGKTRCSALDNKSFEFPGKDLALVIKEWLTHK